uniref:Uncharacterized protein n=1 Tax=Ditylum brightwellii TaxID=49249 RepID=A0A7S4S7C4_9STRA
MKIFKEIISREDLQGNNKVEFPSENPNHFLNLFNEVRGQTFEPNMSIESNNASHHPQLSFSCSPSPNPPLTTTNPIKNDLHLLQQLGLRRIYLENLLRQMKD